MIDPAHDSHDEAQQHSDPRLYVRLAASLRARIQTGELAAGLLVPSIASMLQTTGCSRQTCGKALRVLEQEGLLQRIPGLGYHVVSRPTTDQARRREAVSSGPGNV